MSSNPPPTDSPVATLTEAEWYDLSIDWNARLRREIPVLVEVFGPPGGGGLLDAGCGTGHQASALSQRGYRVVGADLSEEMLAVARRTADRNEPKPTFVCAPYAEFHSRVGGGFDGVYCLANSLAAAGSRDALSTALHQFAECLRPGGRLFLQVLNFDRMRKENPCVKGPRVTNVDGVEYVSVRQFHFIEDATQVTNITLWQQGGWRFHSHARRLYPVSVDELRGFIDAAGMRIDSTWGSYAREPFNPQRSDDLIVVASRV